MSAILDILEKHGLKRTNQRLDVLNLFLKYDYALTHNNLEEALGSGFDRITIYRVLNAFEEKGLIHKVISPSGEPKYALCSGTCSDKKHYDAHLHFSCIKCDSLFCLPDVSIPKLPMSKGFEATSFQIMAQGVCKNCSKKTSRK